MAIDGTGGVAIPIKKPNGESKYIFLYQMVMAGEGATIPVFQMLSAKHDTTIIEYWLKYFLRLADRIPEEVVSDFSLALLNAISLSFNECRLTIYIGHCFKWY